MKKERKVWAITLIAFWCLAPNILQAQQDSTARALDEVVVTATKFPKSLSETAKVLTVIDEEQLARSSGKDLSQLLNEQTGLIINGATSSPGKDKSVYLQGAKSDYTLVLLDGIPLNDPSAIGGGAYDLRMIPIDQVQRVEILKGSQSTLYGSDAIAGVINIITKPTGNSKPTINGNVGYGSFNTTRGTATVSGGTKAIGYSAGYAIYKTDGFSEAKDTTGSAGFDNDGYLQQSVQVNLDLRAVPNLSIKPYLRYNQFDGAYDAGSFADSKVNAYSSNLFNSGLTASYARKKNSFHFLYGHARTDRNYVSDFGPFASRGRFEQTELFWKRTLSENFELIAGASHQNIHMIDSTTTEKDPVLTLSSAYASLFLKSWRGLSAELGGRYNNHSRSGSVFTYSINPSYWINKQIKLFANYSTGFKSPNLNQLFGPFGGNPLLKPEKSQSLEGGFQFLTKNNKADVRVNAFQRTINDVIFYSVDPNTFIASYINLNRQSDHGVEAELNVRPTDALNLRAWYTFVDGTVTDKSFPGDSTYNNLFRRPKHTFGISAGYRPAPKLYVSFNLRSIGSRSDLFFNLSTFASETVTLDAYTLLDLYAEYKILSDRLTVWADAKNVLNQEYYEVYGYNTQPANIMAGLNFRL
ncbi:MAG: TonB-dependent receptor [Cyclobacteriaceae bacterium]|nr:TonB-dependent receptor [Cyclobacteriaceae bacterium]